MGQQLETMLRTYAALCTSAGIKSAELGFRLMHSQIPASGVELKLKQLQGHAQRSLVSCCICSKHGFHLVALVGPGRRWGKSRKPCLEVVLLMRSNGY